MTDDTVRVPQLAQPTAWLEIGKDGVPIGVSLERDYSSPFTWQPLYSAAPQPSGKGCCCAIHHPNHGCCLQCPIHGIQPPKPDAAEGEG